uniref:Chromo domain-containing protein n=1 Tax=Haptolina ericina TaxID=156174 RepID=A0A7S3ASJ2_9EUKA
MSMQCAHDDRVRAFVAAIKRENEEKEEAVVECDAAEVQPLEASTAAAPPSEPDAYPRAAETAPKEARTTAVPVATQREKTRETLAAEATAWLAERGIVAPPRVPLAKRQPAAQAIGMASKREEAHAKVVVATGASLGEQSVSGGTAEYNDARDGVIDAETSEDVSASGIDQLLEFRTHLGNEQWRVRWLVDGEESCSWEVWRVIDTVTLRRRADILKQEATQVQTEL